MSQKLRDWTGSGWCERHRTKVPFVVRRCPYCYRTFHYHPDQVKPHWMGETLTVVCFWCKKVCALLQSSVKGGGILVRMDHGAPAIQLTIDGKRHAD